LQPATVSTCTDTSYYTYNAAGQVTLITYTDGTPSVSYAYFSTGQRCWMYQGVSTNACTSPPPGAETYSYDSLGRMIQQTTAAGNTMTYGYDSQSRLDCVSYPNSSGNTCSSSGDPTGVARYAYSPEGQLLSIADWAGNALTFAYNDAGSACWMSTSSATSCSVPTSGVTTAYGYDATGNISDMATTSGTTGLLNLSVGSRNSNEFMTSETATVGSSANPADSYGYNSSDEVASGPITGSSASDGYSYTPAGGITADTTSSASAAYDQAGVLCWTSTSSSANSCTSPPTGATTYSYNSGGERTAVSPPSGNPQAFGWDSESSLLTCANMNGTSCSTSSPTSSTTLYVYDGDGLRTSATLGSATTTFTWSGEDTEPQLLSDGTWDYVYLPGAATPVEQIATSGSSPTTDLLLSDEIGNVRGLVQLSSGTQHDLLVNYTDYDAYGTAITQSGGSVEAGGLTVAQTGINSNYVGATPWGFAGGYSDPTGLLYLVHRYYDPRTAQFLSVDPALSLTDQPYEYGSDNPTTFTDHNGEYWSASGWICGPGANCAYTAVGAEVQIQDMMTWEADAGSSFLHPGCHTKPATQVAVSMLSGNLRVIDTYNQCDWWMDEVKSGTQPLTASNRAQILNDDSLLTVGIAPVKYTVPRDQIPYGSFVC
jgi:RHS repeat-associated protein